MQKIDYESWERRELFEFFDHASQPFYSVTFKVDVTELYSFTHSRGLSFYYALVYLVAKAVNSVPNFRYAIEEGEIVLFDELMPSFTDMHKGSEIFHIVTMPCVGSLEEFCAAAKAKSEAQNVLIDMTLEGKNLIFISCLPWIDITALTNERNFDRDDNVTRIAWGKFTEENGRKVLGMSLELNHRFCDGVHIGKFAAELERLIKALG